MLGPQRPRRLTNPRSCRALSKPPSVSPSTAALAHPERDYGTVELFKRKGPMLSFEVLNAE